MNRTIYAALAVLGSLLSGSTHARAEPASASGKGITGGALLGAETVLITETLLGVESSWILLGSAAAGAGAGAFGGYYVESAASPRVSFYLLVGGMALLIPTAILYADAAEGSVPDEVLTDPAADRYDDELDADPPAPTDDTLSQAPAPSRYPSLLALGAGRASLGLPNLEVSPVYSETEVREYGAPSATQYLFPVVHVVF